MNFVFNNSSQKTACIENNEYVFVLDYSSYINEKTIEKATDIIKRG